MMPIISTIFDGATIPISENENIQIKAIQGLTEADAIINTSQRIDATGVRITAVGVRARNITMLLCPQNDVSAGRELIYEQFSAGQNVTLLINAKGKQMTIEGIVESVQGDLYEQRQEIQVSIICPIPYFTDANDRMQQMLTDVLGTHIQGQRYSTGCEITITSQTAFGMLDIGFGKVGKIEYFRAELGDDAVRSLTVKSYDDDKRIVGHPIDAVYGSSRWLRLKPGDNLVSLNLYKYDSVEKEWVMFDSQEYEGVTAWISEPIHYGGI